MSSCPTLAIEVVLGYTPLGQEVMRTAALSAMKLLGTKVPPQKFVARNSLSKSCTDLEDGRGQRRLILSKSLGESQDDDKIFFKNIRSAIWRLVLKGRSPKWRCRSSTGTPSQAALAPDNCLFDSKAVWACKNAQAELAKNNRVTLSYEGIHGNKKADIVTKKVAEFIMGPEPGCGIAFSNSKAFVRYNRWTFLSQPLSPFSIFARDLLAQSISCTWLAVDKCQKECTGGNVDSIANAQRLRDCTYIKGSLEIQIRGGINVVKELEENLNKIEEISGYLKIVRSFPIMSLNFLKKLRIIHGNDLESGKYSLVVLDNQNLVELWDWENKGKDFQIKRGRLFFHFNPKLCIDKITELKELAHLPDFTDLEVAQNSNGDKVACNVKELEVKVYKSGPKAVLIKWRPFTHYDSRTLLGYVIYTIEAPYQNVTMYDGRDACGGDGWRVDDIAIPEPSEKEVDWMDAILTLLEPYTQYAFYIKTYTIATEKVGAQSKIKYFRTHPDTPSVPRALKVYSNSSSELIINWSPPRVPNGNVTHYIVRGQWERDDQKFLDQRNYCKEPLSLPDNKHSQTKVDEDGTDLDPDGLGLSNIYTKKDCVCKKDDKEERGKKQREKEIQFQIQFEDALHNQVYVKRKNAPDDLNTVPTELDKKRPQRDKREIKFRNDIVNNEYPRVEKTSLGSIGEPKNKLPGNDEETFEHEVWGGNSLVVHKLHHFAHYTISVTACREVLDEETDIGKKNNCSAQAIFSTRTQPLNPADTVPYLSVEVMDSSNHNGDVLLKWEEPKSPNDTADTVPYLNVEVMDSSNHSGDVLLKWEEPKSPNGLIVTYQIEYTRSDIENYKPQIVCITRRKFHNLSKSYILKDLSPGNYSVKVRATSLAGNGNYTESVNFYIQERQSITMLQMLIITIAIVILLVGLVFLALVYHRKQMAQEVANSRLIASVNPEYVSTMYVADQWEVPREQIELVKELGQGSFGMVWRGIAYNIVPGHEKMDCAVKTVNETASDRERIEFLNEASVMKGFNTHHVVQLLGVVSKGQPTLVVMELMANGDLKSYLRSHRPDAVDDPTKQPPTLRVSHNSYSI
ncbi:hypothetical protein J6590_062770 [Homalodisca vitripennis]|nr:hypothetical protein J6590_062770 [Homalodisca vitripennis]